MACIKEDLYISVVEIDDLCRFCCKPLRLHGVLGNSVLLFEPGRKSETSSILQRLAGLGLSLTPNTNKSKRMCKTCFNLVCRLERDLAVFNKWQLEEDRNLTDETSSTQATSESTDKKKRLTLPDTPRAVKKIRLSPPPGARRSITQVITAYPSKTVVTVSSESEAGIIQHINKKNWKTAANLISAHKDLFQELKFKILSAISEESQRLSNPNNKFMLWKTAPEDLKSFSFDKLVLDLEDMSPFLLSIFKSISPENLEAACAALCIALRGREPRMSAFAYYINGILQHAGIKKSAFNRLSTMAITTSYERANRKKKEFAATCGETLEEIHVSTELFLTSEAGSCEKGLTLSEEYPEGKESEDLSALHFSRLIDSDAADATINILNNI